MFPLLFPLFLLKDASIGKSFQPSLVFVSKVGANLRGGPVRCIPLG
jgi:hypothetical protein